VIITMRRSLLDDALERARPLMRGHVLDVGGRKINRRGRFTPPLDAVSSWKYLNPDPAAQPDHLGSADAIPLPDGSVDTVILTEVLEYLPDCGKALGEIRRVLAPGGVLILTVPFLAAIHGDPDWDRDRPTAVRIRELAATAGLVVSELREMGGLGAVLHDLFHVYLGYAAGGSKALRLRFGRRALSALVPIFRWMDSGSSPQRRFIHTGYFAILRKP
jgi:SAM-dependent methyltransferase